MYSSNTLNIQGEKLVTDKHKPQTNNAFLDCWFLQRWYRNALCVMCHQICWYTIICQFYDSWQFHLHCSLYKHVVSDNDTDDDNSYKYEKRKRDEMVISDTKYSFLINIIVFYLLLKECFRTEKTNIKWQDFLKVTVYV